MEQCDLDFFFFKWLVGCWLAVWLVGVSHLVAPLLVAGEGKWKADPYCFFSVPHTIYCTVVVTHE